MDDPQEQVNVAEQSIFSVYSDLLAGKKVDLSTIPINFDKEDKSNIVKRATKAIHTKFMTGLINLDSEKMQNISNLLTSEFYRSINEENPNYRLCVHLLGHAIFWMTQINSQNYNDPTVGDNLYSEITKFADIAIELSTVYLADAADNKYSLYIKLNKFKAQILEIWRSSDPSILVLIEYYINKDFYNPLLPGANTSQLAKNFQDDAIKNDIQFSKMEELSSTILADLKSNLLKWKKSPDYQWYIEHRKNVGKILFETAATFQAYYVAHNLSYREWPNSRIKERDINLFLNTTEFTLISKVLANAIKSPTLFRNINLLNNINKSLLYESKGAMSNVRDTFKRKFQIFNYKVISVENLAKILYEQEEISQESLDVITAESNLIKELVNGLFIKKNNSKRSKKN
jgi:hypothetical protein